MQPSTFIAYYRVSTTQQGRSGLGLEAQQAGVAAYLGIGRKLLEHVIHCARTQCIRRLYLETNSSLRNAIHLYQSVGFRHLAPEKIQPSPYARADVYMELIFR